VTYYVFDYVRDGLATPYRERVEHLAAWAATPAGVAATTAGVTMPGGGLVRVVVLPPTLVPDADGLAAYERDALADGFEGVMVRRMDGRYKPGRSTLREGLLLKIKRFADAEATVLGVEELLRDTDEQRSGKKAGLVAGGTLGALVAQTPDGQRFKIGTGFSAALRDELWARRDALPGELVKYKHMVVGSKNAPRFPVFLGLRHADD
jgi:DNA ligase-1